MKLPIRRLSGRTLGSGDGVFASWYFEKEKYAIQPEGTETTYLAGLYRFEEHQGVQVPMFAVLTRESVAPVRTIHDRMPLILGKEDLKDWIRPDSDPASISQRALTNMIIEKAGNYPDPVPAFMQIGHSQQ